MFHFYTTWKHHKTEGFLMFSRGIETKEKKKKKKWNQEGQS